MRKEGRRFRMDGERARGHHDERMRIDEGHQLPPSGRGRQLANSKTSIGRYVKRSSM